MFENYPEEERLRKIKRATEIVRDYRAILNKNIHMKATQAYQLLKEKHGQNCPTVRTLKRWRKQIPETTSGVNQAT